MFGKLRSPAGRRVLAICIAVPLLLSMGLALLGCAPTSSGSGPSPTPSAEAEPTPSAEAEPTPGATGETEPPTTPGPRLEVLASFYPLQFVAEQVGGDLVDVTNLTPPAADPHNLELSMASARRIETADLVVILSGFQPAVDQAVAERQPARLVDAAAQVALLSAEVTGGDGCDDESHDHGHDDPTGADPHFWLDPTRLAQLAGPVAEALAAADPAHAAVFEANAASLEARLAELDQEMQTALAPFAGAWLVTNHTAFGYLAHRYGLNQVGVTGLDHDIEPSPARMREISEIAREHNVQTLFYENLVSPRVVRTLADDLGIHATVLDTLEGLSSEQAAAGADYFSVMRTNLRTLVEGLTAP